VAERGKEEDETLAKKEKLPPQRRESLGLHRLANRGKRGELLLHLSTEKKKRKTDLRALGGKKERFILGVQKRTKTIGEEKY